MISSSFLMLTSLSGGVSSSLSWTWFVVYFALLAGGKNPQSNEQSHQEHLLALISSLEQHRIPSKNINIFWADGIATDADRRLPSLKNETLQWVVDDTPWAGWFENDMLLANTRWEGFKTYPAKRKALREWFRSLRSVLKPNDSVFLAVTDHGSPDPRGGWQTAIELWGEQLTVEELYQDLQILPNNIQIHLWMSQCFSGGFARLATMDSRVCGAFSSTAHRPAYGCFSLPKTDGILGHFLNFNQGLGLGGRLDYASRWTVEHDQTPDTPHLSSDAFVQRVVKERSEALGIPIGHLVDGALPQLNKLNEDQQAVVKTITNTSLRFNLGLTHSYTRVNELSKEVARLQYTLETWHSSWEKLTNEARLRLLKKAPIDAFTQLSQKSSKKKKRIQAKKLKRWIKKALRRGLEGKRGLLKDLHQKLSKAEKLLDHLKTIEASLWRIANLYAGLAAKEVLTPHDYKLWNEMKDCEAKSILTPHFQPKQKRKRRGDNIQITSDFPTLSELRADIEALRPGYLAFQYRERSRASKLEVRNIEYGSPMWAVDLQVGDIVERIDGEKLSYSGQINDLIALHPIGEWLSIKRRRGHKQRSIHIPVVGAPLSPPPPKKGDPIPPLLLDPILKGEQIDYLTTGGRPTILYFWATWCKECLLITPQLKRWAQKHDIQVLAITTEDPHLVRAVNSSSPLPFTLLHDRGREATRLFRADLQQRGGPIFIYLDVERRFIEKGVGMGQDGPQNIELLFDNRP